MNMDDKAIMQMAQMVQAVQKCNNNPEQLLTNLLQEKLGNNQLCVNLVQLAQARDGKQIESVARGLCQQQGLDFDKEISTFRQIFNI